MHAIRIYIVASHPLFAQGVSSLLESQPDLQVVGLREYCEDTLREIEALHPDVVIVDSEQSARAEITDALLTKIPGLKLVGLSLEEDNITITYLQQTTGAAVEDLVAAVRVRPSSTWLPLQRQMRILAAIQGPFGQRVVENVQEHAPSYWNVSVWRAPPLLPPDKESLSLLLPKSLPAADLLLGLGESPQLASLFPEMVARSGARAMVVPIENHRWTPQAVVRQLGSTMGEMGVPVVFPKPFCSLTMRTYNEASWRVVYTDAHIAEFARYFGRPELRILFDDEQCVTRCEVRRDTACGLVHLLVERLAGCPVDRVEEVASQLLCGFGCPHRDPGGATVDPEYGAPLEHVTGSIVREAVRREVAPFLDQGASVVMDSVAA